jgi:plastocyanin
VASRLGLLVFLASALSACAQTPPAAGQPTPTAPPPAVTLLRPTPPPATASSRSAILIDAAEQYFYPAQVTVRTGTTVVWRDIEGTHDMVADDRSFASAVLFEGATFSHTFTQPGSYRYICTLHLGAGMWAEVTVE